MSIPEFSYLPHDKEQLLQALERFDGEITVEDVTDGANVSSSANNFHTLLLQVLLECICNGFVQNEYQREILLAEVCKRLSDFKLMNSTLLMDKQNPLRIKVKQKLFEFIQQILNEVIPNAEIDSSSVSFLLESDLSSNPDYRYCKRFEELGKIGEGGFGVVFKARCKLTEDVYAVKKIKFNYKNDDRYMKVMREAKNISALNHNNVVRYNNCWIEVLSTDSDVTNPCSNIDDNGSFNFDNCGEEETEDHDISFCAIMISDKCSSRSTSFFRSSDNSTEQNSSSQNSDDDLDSVIFSNSIEKHSGNANFTIGSSSEIINDSDIIDEATFYGSVSHTSDESEIMNMGAVSQRLNFNVRGILYIQMEYCDCDLRFWLDERAKKNKLPFEMDVTTIFSNILNGVAYIHSKDIIHRDLKPQNIFYSKASNCLKIGDFGLATLAGYSVNHSNYHANTLHSTNIGTLPYAAPEQIGSKSYDSKVDIYSLGIILIELMNTFSTFMEFSRSIDEIRNGSVTEEMKKLPKLISLVQNLISNNPKDRMCAKEILNALEEDTLVKIKEMERALKEKNFELTQMSERVNELKEIIHQKDKEIRKLKAVSKLQEQLSE